MSNKGDKLTIRNSRYNDIERTEKEWVGEREGGPRLSR